MKIALVSPYDWATPGGVNEHIAPLAERLIGAGHDVRIVAPSSHPNRHDPEYLEVLGESAFGLPATGSVANVCLSYDLGPRVKQLCAREKFDVVHVHEPFMPLLPFQFLRYSNATNVATFHAAREGGSRLYAYSKFIIRPWWGRLHGRIAVSSPGAPADRQAFRGPLPDHPERGRLRFLRERRADQGAGGRQAEHPVPGPAGEAQGACRSCWRLTRRSSVISRTRASWSWEATAGCARCASCTSSATGCRTWSSRGTCRMKRKPRYFKSADIFCAPNTGGESMGIVLLEALAAGAPIVASRIEGFSDVLTDGSEGFLAPPRDSDALAAALKRLLSDQELRKKMGQQAVKTARAYDWDRVSKQITGYYEECMAERNGATG